MDGERLAELRAKYGRDGSYVRTDIDPHAKHETYVSASGVVSCSCGMYFGQTTVAVDRGDDGFDSSRSIV